MLCNLKSTIINQKIILLLFDLQEKRTRVIRDFPSMTERS